MKVIFKEGFIDAPVVGSYGLQEYPIVSIDGEEYVAEECYVSEKGEVLSSVCRSRGCDYCDGHSCTGCRYGIYSDCEIAYVV